MRQLLITAAGLVLLTGAVGCCCGGWHYTGCTTGCCDCDPGTPPCCYGPSPVFPVGPGVGPGVPFGPLPVTTRMSPSESISPPMAGGAR